MACGVRQGCPRSPLLFVLVADVLLRRLQAQVEGENTTRAFADDVAMVMEDSSNSLQNTIDIYKSFGSFSGLNLNWGKTILIPLWDDSAENQIRYLIRCCEDSSKMEVSAKGIFL